MKVKLSPKQATQSKMDLFFRLIAEMEQQIVEVQREYDESKEECLGHQKVIQDLKASLEQVRPAQRIDKNPSVDYNF